MGLFVCEGVCGVLVLVFGGFLRNRHRCILF